MTAETRFTDGKEVYSARLSEIKIRGNYDFESLFEHRTSMWYEPRKQPSEICERDTELRAPQSPRLGVTRNTARRKSTRHPWGVPSCSYGDRPAAVIG